MPKIYIDVDGWYPVYYESPSTKDTPVELTQEQIENYRGVCAAFYYWQSILSKKHSEYLKEKRNAKTE